MLLFLDKPKSIKVVRLQDDGDGVKKVRVGAVQKGKMELNDEILNNLSADEIGELKSVIGLYESTKAMQAKLDLARFPEVLRTVMEYISSGDANEIEKRFLATALSEAIRELRRMERAEAAPSA